MDWQIIEKDWQNLAMLVGLCFVVLVLAVYVFRGLSLFPKTPDEAPPVITSGFAPSGVGFMFIGTMVLCMIGFSVWTVWVMELEGRTAMRVLGSVPILVGLVFAALYFALKSRGVEFWKKTEVGDRITPCRTDGLSTERHVPEANEPAVHEDVGRQEKTKNSSRETVKLFYCGPCGSEKSLDEVKWIFLGKSSYANCIICGKRTALAPTCYVIAAVLAALMFLFFTFTFPPTSRLLTASCGMIVTAAFLMLAATVRKRQRHSKQRDA